MSGSPRPAPLSRRTLLGAAAVVPTALVVPATLAGCDSGSGTSSGSSPSPTASASPATTGLRFPPSFRWGVATSAYQIEGAAKEDGRGQSIWDTFSHAPGRVKHGDTGDVAADHYHRYNADLDLMKSLGIQTYRFSISWPRIQPDGRGAANQRGLDFYRRVVDGLRQRGIAPVATLFHWDLPQALQDAGGWENRDCAKWFADYADLVFRALGDTVPTWTTINEPKTVVDVGYTYGAHAPGKTDRAAALVVRHHLLLAHGMAVQAYRAAGGKHRIGPVLNLAPVYPTGGAKADTPAVVTADANENTAYLDPIFKGAYPKGLYGADAPIQQAIKDGDLKIISSPIDILGVNYYNPQFVDASGQYVTKLPTSIATWEQIYPQGFTDILVRVKRDYGDIPITILENGVPTDDHVAGDTASGGTVADPKRIEYIRDHIAAMHRAIQQGVRVESYHLWSLLDNFEWAEGYGQRWGIVYVDFATQRRIPKDSATWYQHLITNNGT